MNKLKFIIPLGCLFFCWSCTTSPTESDKPIPFQLSDAEQQLIISEIEKIAELDAKYRSIISLGTMNQEVIEKDKELRKVASIEDYVAFTESIKKDLEKEQIDSLWNIQHQLDYQNYKSFLEIINQYGYPSKERLNTEVDKLFPILLHPPIELEPQKYLEEMEALLLPEVRAK